MSNKGLLSYFPYQDYYPFMQAAEQPDPDFVSEMPAPYDAPQDGAPGLLDFLLHGYRAEPTFTPAVFDKMIGVSPEEYAYKYAAKANGGVIPGAFPPPQTPVERAAAWLGGATAKITDPISLALALITGAPWQASLAGSLYEGGTHAMDNYMRGNAPDYLGTLGAAALGGAGAYGGDLVGARITNGTGMGLLGELLGRTTAPFAGEMLQDAYAIPGYFVQDQRSVR